MTSQPSFGRLRTIAESELMQSTSAQIQNASRRNPTTPPTSNSTADPSHSRGEASSGYRPACDRQSGSTGSRHIVHVGGPSARA